MSTRAKVNLVAIVTWAVLVAVLMLFFDVPTAQWVKDSSFDPNSNFMWFMQNVVRWPGNFVFTLAIGIPIALLHPWRWRASALICLAGIISGIVVAVSKWVVGRRRPVKGIDKAFVFDHFAGGWKSLFAGNQSFSFPSGDVALAFSSAAALGIYFPKWRPAFYGWAIAVAAQRVLSNSHYLSEVTTAAGLGIISVAVARWIWRRWFGVEPIGPITQSKQMEETAPQT